MALFEELPNLAPECFQTPSLESLGLPPSSLPAPKVLLLYGSL
ncbi:MAG TPA: arsenical resistance protein ArsH, partial [Halomonas sp.]|nr:arsenical resistance protein ArsH [Halomonas sp.]